MLLRAITGADPEPDGVHVRLDESIGTKSTQRLALGRPAGGVALFTWPAELNDQALHVYDGSRAERLLAVAGESGWDVDPRPQLAFRNSRPSQRLYMNPEMGVAEYVARWSGPDLRRIGSHEPETIRAGLWPWLREQGFASAADEQELEPFLRRLGRRPAHLRPGLRLLRRWRPAEVSALEAEGRLVAELRSATNRLLAGLGDALLRPQDEV